MRSVPANHARGATLMRITKIGGTRTGEGASVSTRVGCRTGGPARYPTRAGITYSSGRQAPTMATVAAVPGGEDTGSRCSAVGGNGD